MAKTKTVFHEYDPVIYPLKLWVAVNPTLKQVQAEFDGLNANKEIVEFDEQSLNKDGGVVATTYPVAHRKTRQGGLLVYVFMPKHFQIRNITHEAAHCADFICEMLGVTMNSYDNGEAYAYLIGWIAECCEKATKKRK